MRRCGWARVNEYELIVMNVEYDGFIREAVIIAPTNLFKHILFHYVYLYMYERSNMASTRTSIQHRTYPVQMFKLYTKLFGKLA